MKYIDLTQGKRAIVDDELYDLLNKYNWHFTVPYAARNTSTNGKRKVLLMHRVILETPDGLYTDHINGDSLDNRRDNLRVCTIAENARNRGAQRTNTSGYKGVYWYKKDCVWRAQIKHLGRQMWLGDYKTKEAAALAYNGAAIVFHGAFAKLNVITGVTI